MGDAGTFGGGLGAVPVRLNAGLIVELLLMLSVALTEPLAAGLKRTLIAHDVPGGIGLTHVFV